MIIQPKLTTTQRDEIVSPPLDLLIYNTTTNEYNYYNGSIWKALASGGAMSIGGAITGGTPKSLLYVGPGGILAQNTSSIYDYTSDRFGILTTSPEVTFDLNGTGQLRRTADATNVLTTKNSNILNFQSAYWNGSASVSQSMYIKAMMDTVAPTYYLGFYNNAGNERFAISAAGMVGVGGYQTTANFGISGAITSKYMLQISGGASNVAQAYLVDGTYGLRIDTNNDDGGKYALLVNSLSYSPILRVQNDGYVGFGVVAQARVHVKGIGATSATYTAQFHNSSGTNNALLIRDDGRITMGTLQTGNAGLVTGDLYKDSAANILSNGDYVVGMKV